MVRHHLQDSRGNGTHDCIMAHCSFSNSRHSRWNVDLQPAGQHHETRQVHSQQAGQQRLQSPPKSLKTHAEVQTKHGRPVKKEHPLEGP